MKDQYKIQQATSHTKESSLNSYMKLVFGQTSIAKLLLYEFVMTVAAKFPGAAGILLRKLLFPWVLKSVGRNVIFGSGITLRHPHKISIGDNVIIDDYVSLDAKGDSNQGIRLDNGVFLGRNSILSCKNGDIHLKENANLGFNCLITSTNSVTIGKDNIIAAYTYLMGGGNYHIDDLNTPIRELYDYDGKGGVETGENVWLGGKVSILDGVKVGSGCVVAANSVVTKSLIENSIAMGCPAKIIRQRGKPDSK